jgi:hypothetical protein
MIDKILGALIRLSLLIGGPNISSAHAGLYSSGLLIYHS